MKQIFLTALLFLCGIALAQGVAQNVSVASAGYTSDVVLQPSARDASKYELIQLLNSNNDKIDELTLSSKKIQTYITFLESYKQKLGAIKTENIEVKFSDLEKAISNKKSDVKPIENSLVDLINGFSWTVKAQFISTYQDNLNEFEILKRKLVDKSNEVFSAKILKELDDNFGNKGNPLTTANDKFNETKNVVNQLKGLMPALITIIDSEIASNNLKIKGNDAALEAAEDNKANYLDRLSSQGKQINELAIWWGLPLFCGTIIILFLGPKLIEEKKRARTKAKARAAAVKAAAAKAKAQDAAAKAAAAVKVLEAVKVAVEEAEKTQEAAQAQLEEAAAKPQVAAKVAAVKELETAQKQVQEATQAQEAAQTQVEEALAVAVAAAQEEEEEEKDDIADENHSRQTLVEICTVLLLTMSILILGLSDKINSDVLGTLIGGISGYVLNKVRTALTN
jgi:hypothetical protein